MCVCARGWISFYRRVHRTQFASIDQIRTSSEDFFVGGLGSVEGPGRRVKLTRHDVTCDGFEGGLRALVCSADSGCCLYII